MEFIRQFENNFSKLRAFSNTSDFDKNHQILASLLNSKIPYELFRSWL